MRWWDSSAVMYQAAQWLTYAAVGGGIISLFSWSSWPLLAISLAVVATAAAASGAFAWFRLAHLREIRRPR
jgi:hypothetical protein